MSDPDKLPPGWKNMALGDILNEAQLQEVVRIMNEPNLDDFEKGNKLRRYFESFKDQLEARGVVPGYLAYAVVFKAGTLNGKH